MNRQSFYFHKVEPRSLPALRTVYSGRETREMRKPRGVSVNLAAGLFFAFAHDAKSPAQEGIENRVGQYAPPERGPLRQWCHRITRLWVAGFDGMQNHPRAILRRGR